MTIGFGFVGTTKGGGQELKGNNFCGANTYGTLQNGTLHNGALRNGTVQNGTALQNGTVIKWYCKSQNGTLHNGTVTKRYVTKRYTDFVVCYICNSTLPNSMLLFFQEKYNSQKSIQSVDTEDKAPNTWIGWTFGLS